MYKISRHPFIGYILIVMLVIFCSSTQFRDIYRLPPHLRIMEGETAVLTVSFPLTVTVNHDTQASISLNSKSPLQVFSQPVAMEPVSVGPSIVEFRLLGLVPIRTVQVDVLPPIRLIPGGHSIGVVLHSQGVIVVGYSPLRAQEGNYVNPAKEAGISIGDVILSINGIPVHSDTQVAELIHDSGIQAITSNIEIKRGDERVHVSLIPVMCEDTKRYRIGLFVRDSAAGVGTLTFVEPESRIFGALGHVITDSDTNQPIDCEQGKIVLATVSGIQQGKRGQPGEKIGVFVEEDQLLGKISKNTRFGIYGQMSTTLSNPHYKEAIPIASMSQVKTGPAEIMTVVDGQSIEKFAI
jgi:stage IV sporulation protein B